MSTEFASLSDASTAALSSLETAPAAAPAPTAVDTPPAVTPEGNPPAPGTDPNSNIPDFKGSKHKVKVRGTEEEVDYDELLKGYSRQADYTRAKQELADQMRQARELQQAIESREQALRQIYGSDPLMNQAAQVAEHYGVPFSQALQAVVQYQQQQQQGQTPGQDPNADNLVTAGQARSIAEQQIQTLQQQIAQIQRGLQGWTQEQIQAAKAEIETSHQAQAYAQEVNATLSDIFTTNPVLKAVDGMEDLLRFKVYQADPATVEEAKDLFIRFAQEQVGKLNAQFTELNKGRQEAKQKLVSGGIEPPGGSGIVPQPADHKLGSKELRNAAEAYLQSMMR